MTIDDLLRERGGIRLDVGCGSNKMADDWIGIDSRPLPGVDIVHDLTHFPWPLPDESVLVAMSSHVMEHIPPEPPDSRVTRLIDLLIEKGLLTESEVWHAIGEVSPGPLFIRVMDEVWRVLKPGGEFAIVVPFGLSPGFMQDPTHCHMISQNTWAYFDPEALDGALYNGYKPKPWKIKGLTWSPEANVEVVLAKRGIGE
jgi:SAM-dependent methyltransferase